MMKSIVGFLLAFVVTAALPLASKAGTFTPLYSFGGTAASTPDGADPTSGLTEVNGTLYGTTRQGGNSYYGTIYRFDPAKRAETLLYSFSFSVFTPGITPTSQTLSVHNDIAYGANTGSPTGVNGAIFKLDTSNGVLSGVGYLGNPPAPCTPNGVVYAQGALFGTSRCAGVVIGGNFTGGVFEMNPVTGTLLTLYTFTGGADGGGTYGPLSFAGGALYGATTFGGANNDGVIFKVSPLTGQESVLHSFAGATDGSSPNGVIYDSGMLYGTTAAGGAGNAGTAFSIDAASGEAITLHSFAGGADGSTPAGQLVSDGHYLYGTTTLGGTANMGTLFRVDVSTGHEDVLHSFTGGDDGATPMGTLLLAKGVFYGTASAGGATGYGTIFQYVP